MTLGRHKMDHTSVRGFMAEVVAAQRLALPCFPLLVLATVSPGLHAHSSYNRHARPDRRGKTYDLIITLTHDGQN